MVASGQRSNCVFEYLLRWNESWCECSESVGLRISITKCHGRSRGHTLSWHSSIFYRYVYAARRTKTWSWSAINHLLVYPSSCNYSTVLYWIIDGHDGGCGGIPGQDAEAEDSLEGRRSRSQVRDVVLHSAVQRLMGEALHKKLWIWWHDDWLVQDIDFTDLPGDSVMFLLF